MRYARRCSRLNIDPTLLHDSDKRSTSSRTKTKREEHYPNRNKDTSYSNAIKKGVNGANKQEKTSGDSVRTCLLHCG